MKRSGKISVQELFLYAVILKIGATVVGWKIDDRWVLSFAIPLLIMALYVWGGMRMRDRDQVSDEKFADSCYYLGFIFTISSIIVSLFDLPELLTGGTLEDISVRFGAAMVSTVIGLIVRVYLVSFRKDMADVSRAMEEDLVAAELVFRAHLESAVERLRQFNDAVDEASRGVVARLEASIEETAKANTVEFARLFDSIGKQIGESSQRSLQTLDESAADLRKSLQLYATSLVTTAKHHETKLNQFSENMTGKIDTFSYAIGASLSKLTQKIDEFSTALNNNLNNVTFPSQLFADELKPALAELRTALGGVVGQVGGFANSMESDTRRIAEALQAVPETVSRATENIRKTVEQQAKTIEKVNAQEDTLLKLAHNVQYFEIALERAMSLLDEQKNAVADLAEAVVTVAGDHQALQASAAGQIASSRTLSGQMERLSQALEQFAGQLRARSAAASQAAAQAGSHAAAPPQMSLPLPGAAAPVKRASGG